MKSFLLLFIVLSMPLAAISAVEQVDTRSDCGPMGCPNEKGLTRMQVEGDALVKKYCTTCHTEGRIMDKLKELRREQESFEKNLKSIVVKKIRLTGGEISHREGKKILEYLTSL